MHSWGFAGKLRFEFLGLLRDSMLLLSLQVQRSQFDFVARECECTKIRVFLKLDTVE